ncbi:DUF6182 family protein [Streptomyces rubradiris]|uniref:DUF6182 family protein n=1 Tax=Streptomyces rubradiris TaxID=285531 RepID=UPI0034017A7E
MTTELATSADERTLHRLFSERCRRVEQYPEDLADTTVYVVLRSFDVADLVAGAREFTAGLTGAEAQAWLASWTRTRFFFGNPANLTGQHPARVVSPGGTAAWLGPAPAQRVPGTVRLLKPASGYLPDLPHRVTVGPATDAGPRELAVATRGLTVVDYLVHLHHTVVEATLLGSLGQTEPVRVTHRSDLTPPASPEQLAYARVHYASPGSPELRLYAWLSRAAAPTR